MSDAPSQFTLAAMLDITGSIAGLVLLSPLFVALAVLVRYKLGLHNGIPGKQMR